MRSLILFCFSFTSLLGSVQLSWNDNANNEMGYRVERSTDQKIYSKLADLTTNVQTYLDESAQPLTTYYYRVSAFNSQGDSAYSETQVTTPVATGKIINVSVKSDITSSEPRLVAGFVIRGGAKSVLIRGVGPALGQFGVANPIPDPQITLFAGSTQLATNDNWDNDSKITAANTKVGAFQFSNGSKDSALLITLQPGDYTIHLMGVNNSEGTALIEVYDLD